MGILRSLFGGSYDDDSDRREYRERMNREVQRHHEVCRNNYMRQQVIKANQERARKGQPPLPVPPGDWR